VGWLGSGSYGCRTYLSPIILPTNEGCDGTAFWGTAGALLGAGMMGAGLASPVANASLDMSFTVPAVDASDMDLGEGKIELIGTRVSLPR
jgi:hypothetical protein